jgi:hypothetical protein
VLRHSAYVPFSKGEKVALQTLSYARAMSGHYSMYTENCGQKAVLLGYVTRCKW